MEIKYILTTNRELIEKYYTYKSHLDKLYKSSFEDRKKLIMEASLITDSINEIIMRDYPNAESKSEDFYINNINDVETENILMNGMFKREDIEDILEQKKTYIKEEFRTYILKQIENMNKSDLLLIWNM